MNDLSIPWILTAITAIWFGAMARRAERNWVLWGLGGGFFALVTSTIIFGLGHAASIPFSQRDVAGMHFKWAAISVVVIGVLGWLFTLGLHRRSSDPAPILPPLPKPQTPKN
ncbi:MAG TPA: hypothetical protein VG167_05990 [Verrucomicrobiae bacterium]|nr:hypothetical protein [Verrucomicrobiae bacterium]